MVFFGAVNLANIQIPLVNMSPQTTVQALTWTETYPALNGSTSPLTNTILFEVHVSANHTVNPGTLVVVTVGGSEDANFFTNTSSIFVGFFGADDLGSFVKGPSGTGFAGVSLYPSSKPTEGMNNLTNNGFWLTGSKATIDWTSQGDMPLSIVIVFANTTTASHTYQNDVVHVVAPGALGPNQFLFGTAALALGVCLFAVFELLLPMVRSSRMRRR